MRLIDADLLKDGIRNLEAVGRNPKYVQGLQDAIDVYFPQIIDDAPTIDAEPVKHGHWIDNNNKTWSCSICQSWIPDEQYSYARHCLHCGARMDGENE